MSIGRILLSGEYWSRLVTFSALVVVIRARSQLIVIILYVSVIATIVVYATVLFVCFNYNENGQ